MKDRDIPADLWHRKGGYLCSISFQCLLLVQTMYPQVSLHLQLRLYFLVTATTLKLEMRLHLPSWHENMIWYESNIYAHMIDSCIEN